MGVIAGTNSYAKGKVILIKYDYERTSTFYNRGSFDLLILFINFADAVFDFDLE